MRSLQTKVMDLLDFQGIAYRVLPHTEPVYTVEAAAQQRGVVKAEMVKSILLADGKGRYVMACVTGNARLDPQAVRAQLPAGWKRLHFASPAEIQRVTGCVRGAVAPLKLPADVPVIFDQAIATCRRVSISSGDPMAGLELHPADLIQAAGAQLASIAKE